MSWNAFEELARGQKWLWVLGKKPNDAPDPLAETPESPLPPAHPCLFERTTTKAHRSDRAQTRLETHVRPMRWNGNALDLNFDVLVLVVQALLRDGAARSVRALSLVDRQCSGAVNAALLMARTRMRAKAEAFAAAQDIAALYPFDPGDLHDLPEDVCHEVYAAWDAESACFDAFENCMRQIGVSENRVGRILCANEIVGKRWFHSNASVLGHVDDGCELCGSPTFAEDMAGFGTVALFACRVCASQNRVRFRLYADGLREEGVTIRFPRHETVANNYACALLSKRESRRRRMRASRAADARRAVPLARRVHARTFSRCLFDLWEAYPQYLIDAEVARGESGFVIELWHELPLGIPPDLCFAPVLGLRVGDSTRDEATKCGKERLRERVAVDARRKKFNKLLDQYEWVGTEVNKIVQKTGYVGWIQVLDLCGAARAFDLRWMYHPAQSYFGDWRRVRYRVLEIAPHTLGAAATRVHNVARVVRATLAREGRAADRTSPTRACVLEIVRNLPEQFLEADWMVLDKQVDGIRNAWLTLRISPTRHRLYIDLHVDQLSLHRSELVLEVVLTPHAVNRIHDLVGMPRDAPLAWKALNTIESQVNQSPAPGPLLTARDELRLALFKMPGAWPDRKAWFRDAPRVD